MIKRAIEGVRLILTGTSPIIKTKHKISKRRNLFFAYDKTKRKTITEQKGIITKVKKIFKKYELEIMRGDEISENGFKIKRLFRHGSAHRYLLEISYKNLKFFVKKNIFYYNKTSIRAYDIAEKFAQEYNKTRPKGSAKIVVLKPQMLFKDIEISEFIEGKENISGSDLEPNEKLSIIKQLRKIKFKLGIAGVRDIYSRNLFYNRKTNTITLVDIMSESDLLSHL